MQLDKYMLRVAIVFWVVCLVGCAQNLKSVRSFSDQTTTLAKSLKPIVDDIPGSCKRRVEMVQVIAPNEQVYENSLNTCEKLSKVTEIILNYDLALAGYANTLGALAADDFATYTGEFKALSKSLDTFFDSTEATDTDKAKGKAAISLLEFIANAATEGYRQKELKIALHQYENVNSLADAIKDRVSVGYSNMLRNEVGAIYSAQQLLERQKDKQPFAVGILNRELKLMLSEIIAKEKSLEEYEKALESMKVSLEALHKDINDLSSKEIVSAVNNYGAQMYELRKTLNKAF